MRQLKTPTELQDIIKFDGEPLTRDDIHFLYCGPERLSLYTIAALLDAEPIVVFYHMRKHHIGTRKEDQGLFGIAMKNQEDRLAEHAEKANKRFEEEKERREKELWTQAEKLYGKPKPDPIIHVINGRRFVDDDHVKAYNKAVKFIYEQLHTKSKPNNFSASKPNSIRHVDLSAMRLHRGLDMFKFSEVSGLPYQTVKYFEKTRHVLVPKEISDIYFKALNISKRELRKILECLSGDRKTMYEEERREIPHPVREYVWKRDQGQCTKCGREEYLHYHHIEHFAKGGSHQAKNLKLLCVSCHAIEHYGEPGYGMLKAQAEKLLGVSV